MTAADKFSGTSEGLSSPEYDGAAVVPSDTVDLAQVTRSLWVGSAGNVTVILVGGETVTFTAVAAGTMLPIRVSRVKATSTTATNMVALW